MKAALALPLLLAACLQAEPRDGEDVLPVAAMMEYEFDYQGTNYPIRLVDSLNAMPGDLTVFGLDPSTETGTEERLTEVAQTACEAEGRFFDRLAEMRVSANGTSLTFVGACL